MQSPTVKSRKPKGAPSPSLLQELNVDSDDPDDSKPRRWPMLQKFHKKIQRVPPRCRWAFIIFWFGWKIVLGIIVLGAFQSSGEKDTLSAGALGIPLTGKVIPKTRILYVVTTLAEYNTGARATTKDQDRLGEVLIPTLVDSVRTMVEPPFFYHVDVVLICAYELKPEREELIRTALPGGTGLQVWDSAAPLGYEKKHSPNKVIDNTRALARQHRFVIKDKFPYYDIFLAFEDDMRITGHHVEHFITMSSEIDRLREAAPFRKNMVGPASDHVEDYRKSKFYGAMSKEQLARVIPGFVRVEVLLNETEDGAQTKVLPIDPDYSFLEYPGQETHIDPRICCHVGVPPVARLPASPSASEAVIWETNAKAFTLRQLPKGSSILDWVVVMMGPGKRMDPSQLIGGYWAGREGAFGDEPRPSGGDPQLIAQQGGWMLTREQIYRMHAGLCFGAFLPPYDTPQFTSDGQASMNVEFWSGSYQVFTGVKGGCNMQRIMSIHPDHFSKHLIYHTANNKQKQLDRKRMLRADILFGQLNTVRKMAERAKKQG
jgi:hypothetical protein